MPDAPKFTASIDITGKFRIGPNPQPPNQFQVVIRNDGGPVTPDARKTIKLVLTGELGTGPTALFADEGDAKRYHPLNAEGWIIEWDFSDKAKGKFGLIISSTSRSQFDKKTIVTIRFPGAISKTEVGRADLLFKSDFTPGEGTLSIDKIGTPDIISFTSKPEEGVKVLPGTDVHLHWLTHGLSRIELFQLGRADPLPGNYEGDKGSRTIPGVVADTHFQLRGYHGDRPIDRVLAVEVLRNGWSDVRRNIIQQGDPGYPRDDDRAPVLDDHGQPILNRIELEPILLLAGSIRLSAAVTVGVLYGIFRHEWGGADRLLLFETENPLAGWSFVAGVWPDDGVVVPDGFGSSPGVYFDNRIWLLGGSQTDVGKPSSAVWCFNPTKRTWESYGTAGWPPRTGHAVVVFQNPRENNSRVIWVMGGLDVGGDPLNDVWTLDTRNGNKEWEKQDNAPWSGRCLFNPVVFDNKIWLYGGVLQPQVGEEGQFDDLFVYTPRGGAAGTTAGWRETKITRVLRGANEARRPIASTLQVFKNYLHLFGTFRTVNKNDNSRIIEQLAFRLSEPSTRTWMTLGADGLQNWGSDTTFSYQAVNFNDTMLIVRALEAGRVNPVLKVYVPS
jgi:hypothetical protein